MFRNLEDYLREIDRYLAVKKGGTEILAEIRSHILEKAENEYGPITEESVQKVIASYGRPRDVAERYLEGSEIIAPAFRKHLFRYTWILFAVNAALAALAIRFGVTIIMFPFFYIPEMTIESALVYLPMAWLADFGLAAFVLFIVTQRNKDLRLPWLRLFRPEKDGNGVKPPRPAVFILLLVIFSTALALFIRYHTIFFYSLNLQPFKSLMDPLPSIVYSLMVLAAILFQLIAYGLRFWINSVWIVLIKNISILFIYWAILSCPIEPLFRDVPGIDLNLFFGILIAFLIAVKALKVIRDLVFVVRTAPTSGLS